MGTSCQRCGQTQSLLYEVLKLIIVTRRKKLVIRSNVIAQRELRGKVPFTETTFVNQNDKLEGVWFATVDTVGLTPSK